MIRVGPVMARDGTYSVAMADRAGGCAPALASEMKSGCVHEAPRVWPLLDACAGVCAPSLSKLYVPSL